VLRRLVAFVQRYRINGSSARLETSGGSTAGSSGVD